MSNVKQISAILTGLSGFLPGNWARFSTFFALPFLVLVGFVALCSGVFVFALSASQPGAALPPNTADLLALALTGVLLLGLFMGIKPVFRRLLKKLRRVYPTDFATRTASISNRDLVRLFPLSIWAGLSFFINVLFGTAAVLGGVLLSAPNLQAQSCNCFNYVYLNDVSNYDGVNGFVHKFRVNADGTLTEMPNGTTGTLPWFPVGGGLPSPHGLGQDLNGNLYIGEASGGDIRRLTCDGTIFPETGANGYLVDNGAGFNIASSSEGILFTNPPFEDRIEAYDICTGASIGYFTLGGFPTGTRTWGMHVTKDGTVYVSATDFPFSNNNEQKMIWKYKPSMTDLTTTHPSVAPFIDVDAAVAAVGVPNTSLQVMGLTTDNSGNIYLVAWDASTSPDRTCIFKFNSTGTLIDHMFEVNDANTVGIEGSFGIVYDDMANRLYLSGNDDCVAIVDLDLNYIGTGIPHVASATSKGVAIAKECCPVSTPITVNQAVCNPTLNQKLFLENILGCDGPTCGGTWTAGGGNTGMLFDPCDNSITITNITSACGTFTKISTGGANSACGSFSITLNINVAQLTGPTVSGSQSVCSGTPPTQFTSSGASGSSTLQYQWQSSIVSCSSGFADIVGANSANYTSGAIAQNTYFRLITSVEGSCGTGVFCRDTSDCITVTTVVCACAMTASGETLETCNNNGTTADGLDDYITFSLNPTGTGLGASYSVTASGGATVTLAGGGAATGVAYGAATAFRLQNGSANGTLYTITVTDVSGAPCTVTTTVQQSACSTCAPLPCGTTTAVKTDKNPPLAHPARRAMCSASPKRSLRTARHRHL